MAFFMRALSGLNEKSVRSKRRIVEIKTALDELQCNLDKISNLVKENHEVKVAVERVFDSSPLSAQVFLKSPTRQSLLLNEKAIFDLFSALSDQDMPVAALIFDLSKQHGLHSVSHIFLKYLELISPLLHCKHLYEERYNLFTAIEDAWQIGNLFQDGNSSKVCRSEPVSPLRTKHNEGYGNSPKVVQFVSNFLRKRNAIQQEPVNFQESDTNNPSSAIKPTNNSCYDCKEDVELSKNCLYSSERTLLTEVIFPVSKVFDKDVKIKKVAHQEKPDPEAKEAHFSFANSCDIAVNKTSMGLSSIQQNCANCSTSDDVGTILKAPISAEQSICSSDCQPKTVIDASAHEGTNENFVKVSADVTGDDKAQVTAVCDSISNPYKLSDMEVEASVQEVKTFANFLRSSVFLINDGTGQITADCDTPSKTSYKLSHIRKEGDSNFEHSNHHRSLKTPVFNWVPTSEKTPISFRCHSRHLSYAEGDNRTPGTHFKRVNHAGSTGHYFSCAGSENFEHSARFRRIGYTGSEGHSFSMYTTDSEDESLSVSTEVSLLVAASETQQLDIDPEGIWTASIDYPDTDIAWGPNFSESNHSFFDKQQADMSGCEGRDPEPYNEGAGGRKGLFPCDEKADANISHSTNQFKVDDVPCIPEVMSRSTSCTTYGNSDARKIVYSKDPERAEINSLSQFCSCTQPFSFKSAMKSSEIGLLQHDEDLTENTATMESLQHDAEMTKETDMDCPPDGINHIIESVQRDLPPSVLESIPPEYSFHDELFADRNKSIAYSDINKAETSAQSNINPNEGKSISFKMFTERPDLHGVVQGGESILHHHVGKLYPDSSEVRFSATVTKNGAPADKDEVAVGSFYNITKIPCEMHHKQGITSVELSLPNSEVIEVEGCILAYNTCEETKPLDKFEVSVEKKPNVLDQSILDETAEIISGQDNHIIASQPLRCILQHSRSADQKGHAGERFFIQYAEEPNADLMDLPSGEDQKHIIEHSKVVVHEKAQDEKVLKTDVTNQEHIKLFAEIEQLDFATENGILHLHPVKNSYSEDLAKLDIEPDIVYGSKSKLQDGYVAKAYDEFQDPLNTCNLANCKMVTVLLDQVCTEIATPNFQSSIWSSKRTEDYLIKSMETQKHISTITVLEGNVPIDDTMKDYAATMEGDHEVSSSALAVDKPKLHTPTVSTDGKVSCFIPSTTNLIYESDKHLSKSPCISDQAFICHNTNNIWDVPLSGTNVSSYTSLLCFLRSYGQRKLARPSNPLYCLRWNARLAGATRIKRKTTTDQHKRKWLVCCVCCSQQANHL